LIASALTTPVAEGFNVIVFATSFGNE